MRGNDRAILSYAAASRLTDEIMAFLVSCGGPYTKEIGGVQKNIILALVSGQYVLGRDEKGEIEYFASYFRVGADDFAQIRKMKPPLNSPHGNMMYVSECGCAGNMRELVRRLKKEGNWINGACWHRRGIFKNFPNQRGM